MIRLIPTLHTGLAAFVSWWTDELAALLPRRFARRWVRAAAVVIERNEEAFILSPAGSDAAEAYPISDWAQVLTASRPLARAAGSVKLVLPQALCLVRAARIPSSGTSRVGDILALDLERLTPFRRGDVCFGWRATDRVESGAVARYTQAVVKRALLSPMIEGLHASGFQRVFVDCRLADGSEVSINLPAELARNRSRFAKAVEIGDRMSAAALAIVLCGAVWMTLAKQREAIRQLDEQIASAQSTATAIRSKYDDAQRLAALVAEFRRQKQDGAGIVDVLAELTRIVPDTAWVTDIQIAPGEIAIAGFATSAPELIGLIDASSLFEAVAFASPVVRAPRENADRYNISFRLRSREESPDGDRP
jgi:general secretion pathway protein L